MKHQLSISQVKQSDLDILVFLDTSEYIKDFSLTNPLIRVFPPDLGEFYIELEYHTETVNIIRPKALKYCELTSGVYKIIQSVCPNEKTEVTHYLFHAGIERKKIKENLCNGEEWSDLMLQLDIAEFIVSECPEKSSKILKDVKFQIKQKELCPV